MAVDAVRVDFVGFLGGGTDVPTLLVLAGGFRGGPFEAVSRFFVGGFFAVFAYLVVRFLGRDRGWNVAPACGCAACAIAFEAGVVGAFSPNA